MWSVCFCLCCVIPGDWPHWWFFFHYIAGLGGKSVLSEFRWDELAWFFKCIFCLISTRPAHLTVHGARVANKEVHPPPLLTPFEAVTHWEPPSACCDQTNCFPCRLTGLFVGRRAGRPARLGLCRPLSILTHLYAITSHPSLPWHVRPAVSFFVCLFVFSDPPQTDNSLIFKAVLGSRTELEKLWFGSHWSFVLVFLGSVGFWCHL